MPKYLVLNVRAHGLKASTSLAYCAAARRGESFAFLRLNREDINVATTTSRRTILGGIAAAPALAATAQQATSATADPAMPVIERFWRSHVDGMQTDAEIVALEDQPGDAERKAARAKKYDRARPDNVATHKALINTTPATVAGAAQLIHIVIERITDQLPEEEGGTLAMLADVAAGLEQMTPEPDAAWGKRMRELEAQGRAVWDEFGLG